MLGFIRREWGDKFRSKLNWTKKGNWHLTLKFLGDVQGQKVSDLKQFMIDLDVRSFFIQGSGAGFFGSKGVYRVIWLGLKNDVKALIGLAGKIDHSLEDMGFEREKRPFRGHLTLARVKYFYKDDPWDQLADYLSNQDWPIFEVKSVVLWKSTLNPSGPSYEVICKAEA